MQTKKIEVQGMTKKELDVFLSSDQEEFARVRNSLSKKACAIPFLTCTPLELRTGEQMQ
jgi:hypothetical protein